MLKAGSRIFRQRACEKLIEPQPRRKPKDTRPVFYEPDPSDHLANQLNVLKKMFEQKKDDDYHANFDYASQRALFTMKTRRASEFGDMRIYTPKEMLSLTSTMPCLTLTTL